MSDKTLLHDCPEPPRRLLTDRVLLKKTHEPSAWDSRRANKMKERFPVGADRQPFPSMNLIAPIQPSIRPPFFSEKSF